MNRNNNFQFLRILFALIVLLAHSSELVDGDRRREILTVLFSTVSFGEVAVGGFFLLSGFLIVQSWERTPELRSFLLRRFLRVYPAFLIAAVLCALVVGPLGSDGSRYWAEFDFWHFVKSAMLLQQPAIPEVFEGQPHAVVNASMWTISYEVRCYFLVALFGICGTINRKRLWLLVSLVGLVLSVLPLPQLPGNTTGNARLVAYFCVGGSFYLFRDRVLYSKPWVLLASVALIASMFTNTRIAHLALSTAGAYILFWFAFLKLQHLDWCKTCPDFSYGLYLYGWPTQKLLLWYVPTLSPWLLFLLSAGVSLGCGLLSWHLVERHFLRPNLRRVSSFPTSEQSLAIALDS